MFERFVAQEYSFFWTSILERKVREDWVEKQEKKVVRARRKWKLRIYQKTQEKKTSEKKTLENKDHTSHRARRRNRQGFRVTGRLGRRYFMQLMHNVSLEEEDVEREDVVVEEDVEES